MSEQDVSEQQEMPEAPETGPDGDDGAPDVPEAAGWLLKAIVSTCMYVVGSSDGRVLREAGQGAQGFAMAWATITGAANPAPAPAGPERVPVTDAAVGMAHQAMIEHAQQDPQGFANTLASDPSYLPELLSGAQAHLGDLEGAGSAQPPEAPADAGAPAESSEGA